MTDTKIFDSREPLDERVFGFEHVTDHQTKPFTRASRHSREHYDSGRSLASLMDDFGLTNPDNREPYRPSLAELADYFGL